MIDADSKASTDRSLPSKPESLTLSGVVVSVYAFVDDVVEVMIAQAIGPCFRPAEQLNGDR